MPQTCNQRIDAYFNGPDWSIEDDITLMKYIRIHAAPHPTLSSMKVFNEVIVAAHLDLEQSAPNKVTLLDVKERVRALRSRFYDFKEFINEPGVHFNHHNLTVTIDKAQYVAENVAPSRTSYKVIFMYEYRQVY